MAEFELYCFAQSGNAYRVALMLNLIGADWRPIFVDYLSSANRARRNTGQKSTRWARFPCLCTAIGSSASPRCA